MPRGLSKQETIAVIAGASVLTLMAVVARQSASLVFLAIALVIANSGAALMWLPFPTISAFIVDTGDSLKGRLIEMGVAILVAVLGSAIASMLGVSVALDLVVVGLVVLLMAQVTAIIAVQIALRARE